MLFRSGVRTLAVNAAAPAAPSVSLSAPSVSGSKLEAGTYQVRVTAVNDAGEGAPSASASVAVAAGQGIQLALSSIAASTKAIKAYISAPGGAAGTELFVGNFANVGSGNYFLAGAKQPGLGEAFLLDMSAECMKFKQLAPLSKINFAIVTTRSEEHTSELQSH